MTETNEETKTIPEQEITITNDISKETTENSEKKTIKEKKRKSRGMPDAPLVPLVRSSRKKTVVKQFTYEEKEPNEIIVQQGRGIKLSEIPIIYDNIKNLKTKDNDLLKALARIMFGKSPPKSQNFKDVFLSFSGLTYSADDEKARDLVCTKIAKWNLRCVRDAIDLLAIDRSKKSFDDLNEKCDKAGLILRLVKWLECPTAPVKSASYSSNFTKKKKVEKSPNASDQIMKGGESSENDSLFIETVDDELEVAARKLEENLEAESAPNADKCSTNDM